MALGHEGAGDLGRRARPVGSVLTVCLAASAASACGGASEPASTASTQASTASTQASSTTTTQAQDLSADAAGFPGVTFAAATAGEPGVVVVSVAPDSKSRLAPADVIVACNGTRVASPDELISAIGTPDFGEQFTIRVVRGSHRFTLVEVPSPTAYLGAEIRDATGNTKGAVVVSVAADSPAATAELQQGDVITAVADTQVRNAKELLQALATDAPGDKVEISIARGSRQLKLTVTLAARPTPGPGG